MPVPSAPSTATLITEAARPLRRRAGQRGGDDREHDRGAHQLAGRQGQAGESGAGQEPPGVREADPVAQAAAEGHQRAGQVVTTQTGPRAEHHEDACEPGTDPGGAARAQPFVGEHRERYDGAEQGRAGVADARQRRRDALLRVAEQAERDHVVDHRHHRQVRPGPGAAGQSFAAGQQHYQQHRRADRDSAQSDLQGCERPDSFLDEQEAEPPDQGERQILQLPA